MYQASVPGRGLRATLHGTSSPLSWSRASHEQQLTWQRGDHRGLYGDRRCSRAPSGSAGVSGICRRSD